MFRLVVTYPTPDEPQKFTAYYEAHHLPLAATMPGIQNPRFGYPQPLGRAEGAPFCIFEADFASKDALMAALTSDLGKQVAADIKNYSPRGCTISYHELRTIATAG